MNDHFAIYFVNNAFHSVDDPIDIRIMRVLSQGERTITEVADAMSMSPSTVTTHLRDLKDEGLLRSRISERDSRATIYSMNGCDLVAESDPEIVTEGLLDTTVEAVVSKDMSLMEGIFKMFIYGMDSTSIDVVPSMNILARKIGAIIASRSQKGDFYTLLMDIRDFISGTGIGDMSFAISDCVTVNILNPRMRNESDCYLTREFCTNLIRTALEHDSGKSMTDGPTDREGDYLTMRFRFREW